MNDEPGTAMALAANTIPVLVGPPTLDEWDLLERQAATLAKSQLIPKAYRDKPQEIIVAALWAREMRLPLMQTFSKLNIIEGTPSMSAELMVALVHRAGHVFRAQEVTQWSATAYAKRTDSDQSVEFTFDLEDALAAGLLDVWWERWVGDEGGRKKKVTWVLPRAITRTLRPDDVVTIPDTAPDWVIKQGPEQAKRKDNWWGYPKAMLWARAASQLIRMEFGDVMMGVTLTPEELGAEVDPLTGEIIDRDTPAAPEIRASFGERLNRLKVLAESSPAVRVQIEALKAWFVEWKVPAIVRLPSRFVGAVDERIAEIEQWLVVDATATDPQGRHEFAGPPTGDECATCGKPRDDVGHFPSVAAPAFEEVDPATLCPDCSHPWAVHDGDGCRHVEVTSPDKGAACSCDTPGPAVTGEGTARLDADGVPYAVVDLGTGEVTPIPGAMVRSNAPAETVGDPTAEEAPAPPVGAAEPSGPVPSPEVPPLTESERHDAIDDEVGDGPFVLVLASASTGDPIVVECAPLDADELAPAWAVESATHIPDEGEYVRCPDGLTRQVVAVWDAEPVDVARNTTAAVTAVEEDALPFT